MPSQYPFRQTLHNEYLGVSRVIRAMTRHELNWLMDAQAAKWRDQEARKRQQRRKEADRKAARQYTENLKGQTEEDTKTAQENLENLRTILTGNLGVNLALDWEQLLDRRCTPPFQFNQPIPNRDQIRLQLLGPKPTETFVASLTPERPSFLEFFLPFLRRGRLEREAQNYETVEREKKRARAEFRMRLKEYESREKEAREAYNSAVRIYNAQLQHAKERYVRERDEFLAPQVAHNCAVLALRSRYEAGSPEAVEQYLQMVLERSSYPEPIAGEPDLRFDEASKTLIVNFCLPGPADIPNIIEHKYIASRKASKPVEMKPKEFEAFYDDVIHQVALRTIHEIFVADYTLVAEAVVFNGWVRGIDLKTGKPFTSCVLSCEASRKQFMDLNLAQVSPKECIRGLKGVTAGPLVMLAPVKPIMELNRDDDRFVESKEVLDQLGSEDNLAAMEWETLNIWSENSLRRNSLSQEARFESHKRAETEALMRLPLIPTPSAAANSSSRLKDTTWSCPYPRFAICTVR